MKNQEIIKKAFQDLDRKDFMEENKAFAHFDRPFSIGYGQTISQPSLVLKMTLLLNPSKEDKILEIGTGSGFQTALLAKVSKEVYTIETVEQLYNKAKDRLDKLGYDNAYFRLGDGKKGWKDNAPYDLIMVTAAAERTPMELVKQLAHNGKMVFVKKSDFEQDLILLYKKDNKVFEGKISKVRFVSLV